MDKKFILEQIKALLVNNKLEFNQEQSFLDVQVGDVTIRVDGEQFEVGQTVFVETEDGFIPAGTTLDGDHTIGDVTITITDGVISEIVEAEVPVEDIPVEDPVEELSEVKLQSYDDYPISVKEAAQSVLDYVAENGWGDCGTEVGKIRANQLAKGEPISEDTIQRMYSYLSRHKVDLETSTDYETGCGKLMYDSWGGEAALEWSKAKLDELGMTEQMKIDELEERLSKIEKYYVQFAEQLKESREQIKNFNKVIEEAPAAKLETFKTEAKGKSFEDDPLAEIRKIRSRKN